MNAHLKGRIKCRECRWWEPNWAPKNVNRSWMWPCRNPESNYDEARIGGHFWCEHGEAMRA